MSGCGGAREFAGVEGTVTLDGRPLAEVEVVFVPDALKGNTGNNASAFTDAQGHYKLRSARDQKDGTVLGVHRVFFVDLTSVPNLSREKSAPGAGAQAPGRTTAPRFPEMYTDLAQTPFKDIEIKPGNQTRDFELKSK
jgi:hypothetical protein